VDRRDIPGALLVGNWSVLLQNLDDVETVVDDIVGTHGGAHRVANNTAVIDDDDSVATDTLFLVEAVVEAGHTTGGVGQQRDGQVSGKPIIITGCVDPGLVTLGAVRGAGDDLALELLELVDLLVELDEFIAAAVVLGIEDDDEILSTVIGYADVTDIAANDCLHGEPGGGPGYGERGKLHV